MHYNTILYPHKSYYVSMITNANEKKNKKTTHTSIKSLFAPSEMAARLSCCSGSKSFKAEVRYSPAGVVLTLSEPDFTKATVPSVLSAASAGDEGTTSIECPLLSFLLYGIKK